MKKTVIFSVFFLHTYIVELVRNALSNVLLECQKWQSYDLNDWTVAESLDGTF